MIGAFGNLAFEVTEDKALTFTELARTRKAKYVWHRYLDSKPAPQATGFEADSITLDLRLLAGAGVNPAKELSKLGLMLESQKAYHLVIGGKSLGRFHLAEISEAWKHTDNKGFLLCAEVTIRLLEGIS